MHRNQSPQFGNTSNQGGASKFESDRAGEGFCPSPLELGSPLAWSNAFDSSVEPETVQQDGTRETATVVVRFTQDAHAACYVVNLFFYPEHANASRDAFMRDLSLQVDAGYLRRVANDPYVARNMLLQSVVEHLQVDATAFRDQILRFARVTLAMLGSGNYVFDMTSEVPTVATLDRMELLLFLMAVPIEVTTYFGVVTPSMLRDIVELSSSSAASVQRPHCQFMSDDLVTNEELIEVATDLRGALKTALEGEIRRLFSESYGEVRVFFKPMTCDTPDLIKFLKNVVLVLYPIWQEEHIVEKGLVSKGMGTEIFELSGGMDDCSTWTACMDDGLKAVVADAEEFIEMAFDFLEDDYARWSQKLDPDRKAETALTAEELMSAMRFLQRRMGALAAYLGRD